MTQLTSYFNPSSTADPRTRGSVRRASGFVQIAISPRTGIVGVNACFQQPSDCIWPKALFQRTLSHMGRLIYDDEEKIRLRRGTFLVLYDVLARTLRNPAARKETTPGNFEILFQVDEAERRALHWLVGAIERGVPDAMSNEMPEMIAEHKRWIMSRPK